MKNIYSIAFAAILLAFAGCNDEEGGTSRIDETMNTAIISDFAENIAVPQYDKLKEETEKLYAEVLALKETPDETNLASCQDTWREARQYWEQSESFLFGPVSTGNIDPRIDTWPVNFTDLDAQLASNNEFTEDYIDNLEDALKGFHPIEYLLFGKNGDKKAVELTEREFEYLEGLSLNLKTLTNQLAETWDPGDSDSYYNEFNTAGNGSSVYNTQLEALEELVNAMAGICDEVANGKISEPFLQQDPSQEESPFASNSITDFTNNIKGVQNVYLGKFETDGKGLEDLVKKSNLSLNNDIKLKISNAIGSLNNITAPFGEAIISQPIQVQNAIDTINELKDVIEGDLLAFVQQHAK